MKWAVFLSALAAGILAWFLLSEPAGTPAPATRPATVLNRGVGPEPDTLDPHLTSTYQAKEVLHDLFEGLVTHDANGDIVPGVAEEWEISDDRLEYRFFLRDDARWSNGEPVTAEDFQYSLRRLVNPATAAFYAKFLAPLKNTSAIVAGKAPPQTLGVRAVSARELVMTLEQPTAYFLLLLAEPPAYPVHAGSIAEHGGRFTRPGNLVSNGAYTLEDWSLGAVIELRRNGRYWNDDGTSIDVVRYHVTEEPGTELRRFLAGELDITSAVPSEAFHELKKSRPGELRVAPTLGVYYLGYNLTKAKLGEDSKLREALSLAIDREQIANQVVGRGELPAYSFVPPATANYEPPTFVYAKWSAEARQERAKQLYREAGYGPDNPLEIELHFNTSESHQRVAVAVRDMWRKTLGFEAALVNEQFRVLVANVRAKQITEIFRLNWNGDYDDAHSFLSILESDSPSNLFGYRNEDYDNLVAGAARQTDADKRRLFLEEAEALMLADHPMIPLYFYVGEHLVSKRIRGWQDNALDYHYSQHLSADGSR